MHTFGALVECALVDQLSFFSLFFSMVAFTMISLSLSRTHRISWSEQRMPHVRHNVS